MAHVKYSNNNIFNIVFIYLLTNSNRAFGNICGVPQSYLQSMAFLFGIVNALTKFIWGYFMDKYNFKSLMYIVILLELFISLTVFYSVNYPFLYLIENLLIACCISGTFTMIIPLFNIVFGFKNGAKLYGITGIMIGLASFLGPIMTKFIITDNSNKDIYEIIYLIGGIFVFFSLIVLWFFKEEKFKYSMNDNEYIKLD